MFIWLFFHFIYPFVSAAPLPSELIHEQDNEIHEALLWTYLGLSATLVIAGGIFSGLTIALMGQDEVHLCVITGSGDSHEKRNAFRILRLLARGKHWVLVSLLLSNVVVNEALPILLDRSLGNGWPAVVGSSVLVVVFGEIVPQSICISYGLAIGGFMTPTVLALMYVLAPAAWPMALLLDRLIGVEHGNFYKKAGLKTLVMLHRELGSPGEQLTTDQVTIISAVLDLKEKSVGSVMTPIEDVFTLSVDAVLDKSIVDSILSNGYSRIPVHSSENDREIVGMLLVKMLITYDPNDKLLVKNWPLASLPETLPQTSCLEILNFFQEGKSHMVLVSTCPGEDHGAIGVVTLEDVIEELIGEEIVDESDIYVDVSKAIRRSSPHPSANQVQSCCTSLPVPSIPARPIIPTHCTLDLPPIKPEKLRLRRANSEPIYTPSLDDFVISQSQPQSNSRTSTKNLPYESQAFYSYPHPYQHQHLSLNALVDGEPVVRARTPQLVAHLRHLGPSNPAARPRPTRLASLKIKDGAQVRGLSTSAISNRAKGECRVQREGEQEEGIYRSSLPIRQYQGQDTNQEDTYSNRESTPLIDPEEQRRKESEQQRRKQAQSGPNIAPVDDICALLGSCSAKMKQKIQLHARDESRNTSGNRNGPNELPEPHNTSHPVSRKPSRDSSQVSYLPHTSRIVPSPPLNQHGGRDSNGTDNNFDIDSSVGVSDSGNPLMLTYSGKIVEHVVTKNGVSKVILTSRPSDQASDVGYGVADKDGGIKQGLNNSNNT